MKPPDVVGNLEIAALLGVKEQTVRAWQVRGIFPEPTMRLSGTPIWWRSEILGWAIATKRWNVEA